MEELYCETCGSLLEDMDTNGNPACPLRCHAENSDGLSDDEEIRWFESYYGCD